MVAVERVLQRRERAFGIGQRLDGLDAAALGLRGEEQAGAHGATVELHGAGAAHAVLAAHVRAAQAERVAQEVGQQQAVVDVLLHACGR